jgi:hypothetical protein
MKINLDDDKYTYVMDNGRQYVLRYGEPWKDLCGDKFVYAMACKIEDLEDQIKSLKKKTKHVDVENTSNIQKSAHYSYDIYCDDFEPDADRSTFIDGFFNGVRWKEKQIKNSIEENKNESNDRNLIRS